MTAHRGFTLIELLVVISIIGILSVFVLASLGTTRDKGRAASVKSNLVTLRTQADLYYATVGNGSYGVQPFVTGAASSCTVGVFSNTTVTKALEGADAANGSGNIVCRAGATYYYAAAALPGGGWWCVDSTGASRQPANSLPTLESAFVNSRCPS